MATLVEKILALETALDRARIPHAFGGALALAFHVEEPRGTRDIDINIFSPGVNANRVFGAFPTGVGWSTEDVARVERDGQIRIFWDDTPLDLFFSTHAFHDEAAVEVEQVPFAGATIPVLSATSLTVFKAFFNRTRDWADIESMIDVDTIDRHAALGWLVDLLGPSDERIDRFRTLLDRRPPTAELRFEP